MDHIQGTDLDQLTLFPEPLDDYMAQDNPVRFIDAFVNSLDVQALGFTHAIPAETGCVVAENPIRSCRRWKNRSKRDGHELGGLRFRAISLARHEPRTRLLLARHPESDHNIAIAGESG